MKSVIESQVLENIISLTKYQVDILQDLFFSRNINFEGNNLVIKAGPVRDGKQMNRLLKAQWQSMAPKNQLLFDFAWVFRSKRLRLPTCHHFQNLREFFDFATVFLIKKAPNNSTLFFSFDKRCLSN